MEVRKSISRMEGLCKGKHNPKIALYKLQYLHFRYLKRLVKKSFWQTEQSVKKDKDPKSLWHFSLQIVVFEGFLSKLSNQILQYELLCITSSIQ